MIGLLATWRPQCVEQLEHMAIAELASVSVLRPVPLEGFLKTFTGNVVQDGSDDAARFGEAAAVVEVGKEAANSVGDKDVIDDRITEAVERATRARSALRAIDQCEVKKTMADSASAQSSTSSFPDEIAVSTGTMSHPFWPGTRTVVRRRISAISAGADASTGFPCPSNRPRASASFRPSSRNVSAAICGATCMA
ncbi:conserved hypothetical protein [Ricinus communis]|uniref:Uncharacterized protein n=1 Tax=Ricinus communis TaxID=3988 RepID=B9TGI1_RICCO|nr:conserved hypothetical protein [Ricinus communis]